MQDASRSIIVQCARGYSRFVARAFGLKLTHNHDGHQQYTNPAAIMIAPSPVPSEIMIRAGFAMGMLFEQPGPSDFGNREAMLILEQPSLESVSIANEVIRDRHRRPYYPDILLGHDLPECSVHDEIAETFIQTVEAYVPPHGVSVLAVPSFPGHRSVQLTERARRSIVGDLKRFKSYRERLRETCPPEVRLTSEELDSISRICSSAALHRNDTVLIQKAALARRVRDGSVPLDDMKNVAETSQNRTSKRGTCVKNMIELLEHDIAAY